MDLEKVVELAKNVNGLEYYYLSKNKLSIEISNKAINNITNVLNEGYAFRLLNDRKMGFSSSNVMGGHNSAYVQALKLSQNGIPINMKFAKNTGQINDREGANEQILNLDINGLLMVGNNVLNSIYKNKNLKIRIEKEIIKRKVINSNLVDCNSEKAIIKIYLTNIQEGNRDDTLHTKHFYGNSLETLSNFIDKFNLQMDMPVKKESITEGIYDVIFSPSALFPIILSFAEYFNSKKVLSKSSKLFNNKMNINLDKKFNLYDDPLLDISPYKEKFDDEGIKTMKNTLIENGEIRSYYSDLLSLAKFNLNNSTGNGIRRRGYKSMPTPNFINLSIGSGDKGKDDYIRGVRQGIYIDRLMITDDLLIKNGILNGNVDLAYKIENGELTRKINKISIKTDIFNFFNDIEFSLEKELLFGCVYIPYTFKPKFKVYCK